MKHSVGVAPLLKNQSSVQLVPPSRCQNKVQRKIKRPFSSQNFEAFDGYVYSIQIVPLNIICFSQSAGIEMHLNAKINLKQERCALENCLFPPSYRG